MRFRIVSKLTIMFLALIIIATCVTFGAVRQAVFATSPSCSTTSGNRIVAIAEGICNGQGQAINGWPGNLIVPYVFGGGHNPSSPGPNTGGKTSCKSGQACGVDCSGFTRWVYDLAYQDDILGAGNAQSQIPLLTKVVPDSSAIPGDLVFFAFYDGTYHVGVYIGNNQKGNAQMIDAAHTGTNVREEGIANFPFKNHKRVGTFIGYYRYTSLPHLAPAYQGTVHNITYNLTANYALSSIKEDQQGNISGESIVSPPLYGSGPFTGTVSPDNSITFTSTPTDGSGYTITFTGTVNSDGSLSGSYTVDDGQIGRWQVSPT